MASANAFPNSSDTYAGVTSSKRDGSRSWSASSAGAEDSGFVVSIVSARTAALLRDGGKYSCRNVNRTPARLDAVAGTRSSGSVPAGMVAAIDKPAAASIATDATRIIQITQTMFFCSARRKKSLGAVYSAGLC